MRRARPGILALPGSVNYSLLMLSRSLLASSLACIYIVLSSLVLVPLHERGVAQELLGHLCGLGHILSLPGKICVSPGQRLATGMALPSWTLALLINALFYYVLARIVAACWMGRKALPRPEAAPAPAVPAGSRLSRRSFMRMGTGVAAACGVGGLTYSSFLEPRRILVTRRAFPVRGLPAPLAGLRIVQLTDLHLGPWTSLAHIQDLVQRTNALEADVVALTGDYVHQSPAYIRPVAAALKGLRARIGVAGVLGNHDWWEDGPLMRSELEEAGVRLVDNARIILTGDRRLERSSRSGICLAGVGDLWEDAVRFDHALGGVPEDMPRIVLSHNPDAAELKSLAREGWRVDLMLSGHTHGGQVRLPFLGTPIVPSKYGQKYAQGLVQGPACPVYVSRGLGLTVLPVRLGVPPEIAVIELQQA